MKGRGIRILTLLTIVLILLPSSASASVFSYFRMTWGLVKGFASGAVEWFNCMRTGDWNIGNTVPCAIKVAADKIMNWIKETMAKLLAEFFTAAETLLTWNPKVYPMSAADPPVISSITETIFKVLIPLYVFMLLLVGIYLIFMSYSPQGRAQAKQMLMKLLFSMVIVSVSPAIFQMLIEIQESMVKDILDIAKDTAKSVYVPDTELRKAAEIRSDATFAKMSAMCAAAFINPITILPNLLIVFAAMAMMAIRYLMVVLFAIMFPMALFLYFIDFTKNIGAEILTKTMTWLFMPIVMAAIIAATVVAMVDLASASTAGAAESLLNIVIGALCVVGGMLGLVIAPWMMTGLIKWVGGVVQAAGTMMYSMPGAGQTHRAIAGAAMAGGGMLMGAQAWMAGDSSVWRGQMIYAASEMAWARQREPPPWLGGPTQGFGETGGTPGGRGGGGGGIFGGGGFHPPSMRGSGIGGSLASLYTTPFGVFGDTMGFAGRTAAASLMKDQEAMMTGEAPISTTYGELGVGEGREPPKSKPAAMEAPSSPSEGGGKAGGLPPGVSYPGYGDHYGSIDPRLMMKGEGDIPFPIPYLDIAQRRGHWGEGTSLVREGMRSGDATKFVKGIVKMGLAFQPFSLLFLPVRQMGRMIYNITPELLPPSLQPIGYFAGRTMAGLGLRQISDRVAWRSQLSFHESGWSNARSMRLKAEASGNKGQIDYWRGEEDYHGKAHFSLLDSIRDGTGLHKMPDRNFYEDQLDRLHKKNPPLFDEYMQTAMSGGVSIKGYEEVMRKAARGEEIGSGPHRDAIDAVIARRLFGDSGGTADVTDDMRRRFLAGIVKDKGAAREFAIEAIRNQYMDHLGVGVKYQQGTTKIAARDFRERDAFLERNMERDPRTGEIRRDFTSFDPDDVEKDKLRVRRYIGLEDGSAERKCAIANEETEDVTTRRVNDYGEPIPGTGMKTKRLHFNEVAEGRKLYLDHNEYQFVRHQMAYESGIPAGVPGEERDRHVQDTLDLMGAGFRPGFRIRTLSQEELSGERPIPMIADGMPRNIIEGNKVIEWYDPSRGGWVHVGKDPRTGEAYADPALFGGIKPGKREDIMNTDYEDKREAAYRSYQSSYGAGWGAGLDRTNRRRSRSYFVKEDVELATDGVPDEVKLTPDQIMEIGDVVSDYEDAFNQGRRPEDQIHFQGVRFDYAPENPNSTIVTHDSTGPTLWINLGAPGVVKEELVEKLRNGHLIGHEIAHAATRTSSGTLSDERGESKMAGWFFGKTAADPYFDIPQAIKGSADAQATRTAFGDDVTGHLINESLSRVGELHFSQDAAALRSSTGDDAAKLIGIYATQGRLGDRDLANIAQTSAMAERVGAQVRKDQFSDETLSALRTMGIDIPDTGVDASTILDQVAAQRRPDATMQYDSARGFAKSIIGGVGFKAPKPTMPAPSPSPTPGPTPSPGPGPTPGPATPTPGPGPIPGPGPTTPTPGPTPGSTMPTPAAPVIVERISESESDDLLSRVTVHGDAFNGEYLTRDVLERNGLKPEYKVTAGGTTMWLSSNPYDIGGGRIAVVGFVEDGGELIARSFYRSNSQGVWRYLPEYTTDASGDIDWYGKGYGEESITLPASLQKALAEITGDESGVMTVDNPDLIFAGTARHKYAGIGAHTYRASVVATPDRLDGNFYTGRRDSKMDPTLATFNNPDDTPDFTTGPSDSWTQKSSLYGDVNVDVFTSKNGRYQYMFCSDSHGRAWIGGVEDTTSDITPVGVREKWINGGDLTTPAYEYYSTDPRKDQTGGYGNASMQNGPYHDMYQNYLSKIPVIQEYQRWRASSHGP